jgi:hypothetical protein
MQSSCKRNFVVYAQARDFIIRRKKRFSGFFTFIIRSHNNPQDGEQANHQSKAAQKEKIENTGFE